MLWWPGRRRPFVVCDGDSRDRIFIFSAAGDALLELEAGSSGESPVTTLLVYLSPRRSGPVGDDSWRPAPPASPRSPPSLRTSPQAATA